MRPIHARITIAPTLARLTIRYPGGALCAGLSLRDLPPVEYSGPPADKPQSKSIQGREEKGGGVVQKVRPVDSGFMS